MDGRRVSHCWSTINGVDWFTTYSWAATTHQPPLEDDGNDIDTVSPEQWMTERMMKASAMQYNPWIHNFFLKKDDKRRPRTGGQSGVEANAPDVKKSLFLLLEVVCMTFSFEDKENKCGEFVKTKQL